MEPFRDLLKKGEDYTWSAELQTAFEQACQSITDKVLAGVKTFLLGRQKALVTHLSKSGVILEVLPHNSFLVKVD